VTYRDGDLMHKQFYVYIHKKPDGTPFYVGKGTGNRAYQFSKRTQWHKNIVAKYGKNNIIVDIVNCLNESQAFDLEKIYIKQFKHDGVCLVNLTNGGEGHSGFKQTQQTKDKRAAKLKKFYSTEEGHQVNERLNTHRIGRKNTEQTRLKMSNAAKGKSKSKEHSINLSLARVGKPKSGSGIGLAGVNWVESQKCWKVVECFRGKTTFYGNFKSLLDAAAFRIALQNKRQVI